MDKRVLVPYDRSEQAQYALKYAVESFTDAEIVLLHVVEPFADHTGAGGYTASRYRDQLETAETMLEGVRDWYDAEQKERISTVVRYGRPVHEIIRIMDDEPIDHVVIGSHGRDGAARLLLGSVAETVSRRSPVPVTVVREPPEGYESPDEVLVPFDGSDPSTVALEHALGMYPGAEVTVLYVTHPSDASSGERGDLFDVFENWDEEVQNHIDTVLETATDVARDHNRNIETVSVEDTPASGIIAYAEDHGSDHIVIGSTGRDGISRMLLGSVAETVIRRSPVSVTVVR